MPSEGPEGTSRGSPIMSPPSEQYPSPASMMIPQRASPAFFCSQQTPHRVQSSTNLDLVDCVGSDLLLAMNNLDVSEQQARACANLSTTSSNGGHQHLLEAGGGNNSTSPQQQQQHPTPPPPAGDGFLPLAALAPPPSRQPAWLTSQQQKARAQNEHFPSRSFYGGGGGGGEESAAGDGHHFQQLRNTLRMGRFNDENGNGNSGLARDGYESYPQGSSCGSNSNNNSNNNNGGSSNRGSPGVPPPGFGLESCSSVGSWNGSTNSSTNAAAAAAAAAAVATARRPSSRNSNNSSSNNNNNNTSGGNNPHLDESWTAVLNAPAGSELMEFLTERPSRALVLWNVEAIGEDDLRAACEAYGPLYYLRAEHHRKRVIFVAYYDVRDAINAHRSLGSEVSKYLMSEHGSRPRPAVHFSIELHAGFSYKEGSLVVHNLPAHATEAEVAGVFQIYGDLRGIARHHSAPPHASSFSVEFCSIQDARAAAQELTVRNPWGHGITVEPAVRSDAERALGRQLHSTLNRWTAESAQVNDERMRSTSSSVVMSGRSSDSDSPPPNKSEHGNGREMAYMMDLYTPMTSANTTPATTPGSTPPSGADAYQNGGGKSPGVLHYTTMPLRQHYSGSAGPSSSSSSRSLHGHPQHSQGRSNGGSSSAPPHPMYASSSSNANNGMQHHYGGGGGGGPAGHHHHHHHHHPAGRNNGHHSYMENGGNGGSKPHPLASPLGGPAGYGPSSSSSGNGGGGGGPNGYWVDMSPGTYLGDADDARTPPTPMWPSASLSLSPPSARNGGGMRGSPPLRGMPGAGGPGGLGYKDRSRQMSLDEGRLHGGGGGGCGARTMRCNSDGASQMLMASPHAGPECSNGSSSGGNGGHEFSLDLKKVSKGMDKRTTIMVRNIPNKYTQTMLLQEIDASYRGAYDFFYLPIDFKNKCNVGYAFINFIDYRRIVPFFREFNAQRWKNFNSEKVCAISYARIQGKASMISRFQNSSLMEKDGEYRPLIFHSTGSERGRPEPFPASSKAYRAVGVLPGGGGGGMYGGGGRDRERSVSNSSSLSMA